MGDRGVSVRGVVELFGEDAKPRRQSLMIWLTANRMLSSLGAVRQIRTDLSKDSMAVPMPYQVDATRRELRCGWP